MAVTITRTAWTDDDGSGTTGTVINNAVKTELYNQIDAALAALVPLAGGTLTGDLLFTDATYDIGKSGATRPRDGFFSRNITIGGLLTVNGSGQNVFSGSINGQQGLLVSNATSGTGAYVDIHATAGSNDVLLQAMSQGFTTSGVNVQAGANLQVTGAGGLSVVASHASGVIRFYSGGTTLRAQINANGTQTWAPYGAGTATFDASGNITSVSDVRHKDRIAPLPYGLADVLQLRPVQYGYNAASGLERQHLYGGFLAQDVRNVIPLAVGQDPEGYLTLADRPILGAVVNAVRELAARLQHLEARA